MLVLPCISAHLSCVVICSDPDCLRRILPQEAYWHSTAEFSSVLPSGPDPETVAHETPTGKLLHFQKKYRACESWEFEGGQLI